MQIYLICPVRNATPKYFQAAQSYVAQPESPGIAFALCKKIVPVMSSYPLKTDGKSIPNMVYDWYENSAE